MARDTSLALSHLGNQTLFLSSLIHFILYRGLNDKIWRSWFFFVVVFVVVLNGSAGESNQGLVWMLGELYH